MPPKRASTKKKKIPNPKGNYIIHSPHKKLPKEKDVMNYISFDPGQHNFTIRLEKRVKGKKYCKSIETLAQAKHKVNFRRELIEGKKATLCYSTIEIIAALDTYKKLLPEITIAIIEGQMDINHPMMHEQSVIISYFLLRYPKVVVVEISSKLKGNKLGAPSLDRGPLKRWGIEKARYLAEERDDKWFIDYIDKQIKGKKKSEWKIDDDTDNLIQIEAFCVEVGYQQTKTTKAKNTYKGPARLVSVTNGKKKVVGTVTKSKSKKVVERDSSSSGLLSSTEEGSELLSSTESELVTESD